MIKSSSMLCILSWPVWEYMPIIVLCLPGVKCQFNLFVTQLYKESHQGLTAKNKFPNLWIKEILKGLLVVVIESSDECIDGLQAANIGFSLNRSALVIRACQPSSSR